ncbi:MAG: glycogen debranching protein GlgX [Succinivibrio sp.]|nr:glycogen debranching protein GlgX [Succinivibrio sp.]
MHVDSPDSRHVISQGHCRTLGATVEEDGVNFAIWCPEAKELELLLFKSVDDDEPEIIPINSSIFNSEYYWHVKVFKVKPGQIYAWRVTSVLHSTTWSPNELNKVLLDPYGLRVLFPEQYERFQSDDEKENFRRCAKNAVIDVTEYEWGLDIHPKHSLNRTIIYEMHVKGFTAHPSSGLSPDLRGTYRGLIEKIPYLTELGITAVELMPVYQFDSKDARPGKSNYWGYSPMSFFAPHEGYAADKSLMGPIDEFRDMVKALHRNGIEVILDVVYNHTSEGDHNGPCYCFKGLDKRGYYIINKQGYFMNYSGCGNTLNGNSPVVRNLILDSLIYWKEVMHIDGFRFDLASILARDQEGVPLAASPTLLDIDGNRHLADTKIIAEPWDAGGLYQLGQIAGSKWREWNGQFRDDVRSFMRGDKGVIKRFASKMLGSPDVYNEHAVDPQKSINFITCHDGFTLWDLVCYAEKHNIDNGENNQDGNNNNISANYGYEGEIDDRQLNALRMRQVKNFMAITLLSMGTPMLLMGDEVLHTQRGNNNAYCQDNELTWFNWDFTKRQVDMLGFTKSLISLRQNGQLKARDRPHKHFLNNYLRESRLQWHGVKPFQPDWSDDSHSLGILVYYGVFNAYAYIFVNAYWEDLTVELPPAPNRLRRSWFKLLDTSKHYPEDVVIMLNRERFHAGDKLRVQARSLVVFMCMAT